MEKPSHSSSLKAGLLAASIVATTCTVTSCGGIAVIDPEDPCRYVADPDFKGMLDMANSKETPDDLCELTKKFQWQIICYLDRPWETKVAEGWNAAKNDLGGLIYESDTYKTAAIEGEIECNKNTGLKKTETGLEDVLINTSCRYVDTGGTISFWKDNHGERFATPTFSKAIGVDLDLNHNPGTYVNGTGDFGYGYPPSSNNTMAGITAYIKADSNAPEKTESCSGELYDETYNKLSSKITTIAENLIERE